MEVAVDQPRHSLQSETSPIHPNYTPDSPAQTTYSGYNLMGSMHAQERTCPSVNSFAEVTQTLTSPSPTYPGQSSLSLVQTTYSPSRTSPLPTPTSFSPPHCRPTDTSPASSSVSHSGQTSSHSVSVNDVGAIHSPPRASPAGQASPVHIQSSSSSPDSGQVQRQTPSLASMTYSSPAHAAVACVSPPHSPAQASEMYRSPTGRPCYSPAPDTGTSSGLTGAQLSPILGSSSLDVDTEASSIIQSSGLPSAVQFNSGLVKSTDIIRQTSPTPARSLPDDSPAVNPNQAGLSQVNQSTASPLQTPDRSADENQESTASGSPLYQRLATPVHSSPTQDNTAMPRTSHSSPLPSSPPPCAPPHVHVSPPQTSSLHASQAQTSSMHSSPVCGSWQSGGTQVNPSPVSMSPVRPEDSPGPASPVQPEASPSPGPGSPMRCEASPGPDSISPVLVTPGQSETSPIPDLTSPVQVDPGPGPGSHFVSSSRQCTQTERKHAATAGEYRGDAHLLFTLTQCVTSGTDIYFRVCNILLLLLLDLSMAEEQEEMVQQRKTEEEEVQEPHHTTKESPEEEEVNERTEGAEEQDQEEDEHSSSKCPPAGRKQPWLCSGEEAYLLCNVLSDLEVTCLS